MFHLRSFFNIIIQHTDVLQFKRFEQERTIEILQYYNIV